MLSFFYPVALRFLRQKSDVSADMEEMERECVTKRPLSELSDDEESSSTEEYTMWRMLRTPELHMPVIITVTLQMIQQLSGINAVCKLNCWIISI